MERWLLTAMGLLPYKECRAGGVVGPCILYDSFRDLYPAVHDGIQRQKRDFPKEKMQFFQEAYMDPNRSLADKRIKHMEKPFNCTSRFCNYVMVNPGDGGIIFFSRFEA